jgi:hypothetical protein
MSNETGKPADRKAEAPGIVIRLAYDPPKPPLVSAFIWGGKVRPVPSIPYGRRSA